MGKEEEPEPRIPNIPPDPEGEEAGVERKTKKSRGGSDPTVEPEFPDRDLFKQSPESWFRRHRPDWDEETVERAVELVRIGDLVEKYEILKKDPNTPQGELENLEKEIRGRRKRLGLS